MTLLSWAKSAALNRLERGEKAVGQSVATAELGITILLALALASVETCWSRVGRLYSSLTCEMSFLRLFFQLPPDLSERLGVVFHRGFREKKKKQPPAFGNRCLKASAFHFSPRFANARRHNSHLSAVALF